MRGTIKRLSRAALTIMVVFLPKTKQLYRDVKEHSDKVVTLTGDEQRIQSAPPQNKFFISFWVRFKTKTYIKRATAVDKFVSSVNSATDSCTEMSSGSWVFFVVPYTIEKTTSTSFKLHPLDPQRQEIPSPQHCQTSSDAACVCTGRPFQDLDTVLSDSTLVVPSSGTHQFTLSSFDGTSGKPEVRTLMSGLVTFTTHNLISHQVMAELMKGRSSNLFEVNFLNVDFDVNTPYLGNVDIDQVYWLTSTGGLMIKRDQHVHLGTHKKFADSTSSNKLTKNFCWHFNVRGRKGSQTTDNLFIIRLQLTTPDSEPNYMVHEEIIHKFYLNVDPGTNPNKMESYFTMSNGGTPVKFYEKNNLDLSPYKHLELTSCYSQLYLSETAIAHAIYLEMAGKEISRADVIIHKTVMRDYLIQTGINPTIDTQNDYRDFKFKVDARTLPNEQDRFNVLISDFKATDGGMIEHSEASQHVNSVGVEGSIPWCVMEMDGKCLNCVVTRYFDETSGACLKCSTMIDRCSHCHKEGLCDVCRGYHVNFGATSCLADLADCLGPRYAGAHSYRCDSCEHPPPNTCRCPPNSNLVDSSLGGGRKMCVCKIENCLDCSGAASECKRCMPGFYKKGAVIDECIQVKDIRSLTNPQYGVDKAAAQLTIKPCSDSGCLSCASDYTQCACNSGQFYYTITTNPVENKVCLSNKDVPGYGISSTSHPFTGLTLLEHCSVSSCQDCKQNNLECRQCPYGHYYKPPINGVYEGCYQQDSLPEGWGSRESSLELFDCRVGQYFYDSMNRICHYKALIEIKDISSAKHKDRYLAIYQFRVEKGELSLAQSNPKSEGYLDLSGKDLEDFFNYHFEVQTDPKTELTREIQQGDQIKFSYPPSTTNFNLTFKIKEENLKNTYNSKVLESLPNPVLKFKGKELGTKEIQFQIVNKEQSPQYLSSQKGKQKYLSDQEVQVVKLSSKSTAAANLISIILAILLLVGNFDVTSLIFKVIQLVTIFDKLRFMNVIIKNSFGEFIEYIGELFKVGIIDRDDFHLASVHKNNSFERLGLSVIAYRTKTDRFIMFCAAVVMRIVIGCFMNSLKDIGETEFLKMEKRGRLIKRLIKTSSGILMMTLLDILFVTGHQLLHQKISTIFSRAVYIVSYIVSLLMFCYSCWIILTFIQTKKNNSRINLTKSRPAEDLNQMRNKQTKNNQRLNQIEVDHPFNKNLDKIHNRNADQSDLRPLDTPSQRKNKNFPQGNYLPDNFRGGRKKREQDQLTRLDPRIHKIDMDRTIEKISEDDFMLNFLVDGLTLESFNQIPKIYNLMMLLRICAISVSILCLQSSSFMQSLLLIIIEVIFLGFILKYQTSARALKSKVVFWARVMESVTLALFGVVCLLYSLQSESMDFWGQVTSYPAFTIFVATLIFEYFTLGFSVFKAVKEAISSKIYSTRASNTKISKIHSRQGEGNLTKTRVNQSKNKAEKELLEYWTTHQFILVTTKHKNTTIFPQNPLRAPRRNKKYEKIMKSRRSQKVQKPLKRNISKPKNPSKAKEKIRQFKDRALRNIPRAEEKQQDFERNPFKKHKKIKRGRRSHRNHSPMFRRSKQKRMQHSRLRRDQSDI